MSWTYNSALPTDKDKVRALIGDTDTNNQLITDEFIAVVLAEENNNLYGAGALAALAISSLFARKADKSLGPMSVSYSNQANNFRSMYESLREVQTSGGGSSYAPSWGGASKAQRDLYTSTQDEDFIDRAFRVGGMDNPETALTDQWVNP